MGKGAARKIISYVLSVLLATGMLSVGGEVTAVRTLAATRTLTMEQAVSLGLNNSSDYRKTKNKIALAQVKYVQAVKSIRLKKKNMLSFRYSPLLSFKLPEDPLLSDEYEWTYKPLQLQSEIAGLQHQLTDIQYSVRENVCNMYVQVYTAYKKVEFYNERIQSLTDTMNLNIARLYVGAASQNDVDSVKKALTSANTAYGNSSREYESLKEKLSDLINLDVQSGYAFTSPYIDNSISRDNLDDIVNYTLDKSQTYYEAKLTASLALTSLNTNYQLMQSHYGSKDMSLISSYVNTVRNGGKVNGDAFKSAYDKFLDKVDSYWKGKIRILFIKIPKEWFKGEADGIRYVEDDPYILYTDALEYQEAYAEQQSTMKEITTNVKSGFDNLVTLRNSYESIKTQCDQVAAQLQSEKIQNDLGKLSMEEYSETESSYMEMEIEKLEALDMYTQALISYDRLTCGAITKLLKGTSIKLDASSSGISSTSEDEAGEIVYDIVSKVEDNIFELTITVPEDYAVNVTDFELWIDNVQVGNRTGVDSKLRHLALSVEGASSAFIRLYDGNTFVADCTIDATDYHGVLYVEGGGSNAAQTTAGGDDGTKKVKRTVATYSYTINKSTGIASISINPEASEGIAYFSLVNAEGTALSNGEPVGVKDSFKYLSIMTGSFYDLRMVLYDSEKNELYQGSFNISDMTIEVEE